MPTSKTYSLKAEKLMAEWLGKKAGRILLTYLRTQQDEYGNPRYLDLDERVCNVIPPEFLSPPPEKVKGVIFDIDKVDRFIRFCRLVRHIKGAWAGRPFELELWQIIFVFGPLFGWVDADGNRVIRTLYEEVAKKNGKSSSAAVLGLYMMGADGESGAEVAALAGNKDQARAVHDVAKFMVSGSPELSMRFRVFKDQVTREDKASWFKVMTSGGAYKAGLNIHCGIIDELLVHKSRELVDNIEGATTSRTQPIVAYLSTGGLDDPGSIYAEKRNYAENVALKVSDDHTWHTCIWTIGKEDAWDDEAVWYKANPNMNVSVQLPYLRTKAKQAKANPTAINKFLRDHLNVRTGAHTRWLDIGQWDRSDSRWLTPTPDELLGMTAYGGLDLASSTDLAAFAILIPEEIPNPADPLELVTRLNLIIKAWTPLDTLEMREERDKAPYSQWIKDGWLIGHEGNVIDYDDIERTIKALGDQYNFQRLQFDRWGSKQILQHLHDHFGDVIYEMGQGFASMSAPTKEMERRILLHEIRHARNPLLRYAVQSLSIQTDPAGNIKPNRELSTGRIDPIVASFMALDGWMRDPVFISAYEPLSDSA